MPDFKISDLPTCPLSMTTAAPPPSLNRAPAARATTPPPPARGTARQPVLGPWLRAQALNLGRHTVALRDFTRAEFGGGAEAPSEGHVQAVNRLLGQLRGKLAPRAQEMNKLVARALRDPVQAQLGRVVIHKHRSHDSVRQIEKIWDFYFELFGQRQSPYGSWLLSCDRIALDCYQDAYVGIGHARSVPAPPPFSYMRTGFGPATFRRGIRMKSLGREMNPFPLVQLPYHRLVNPWTLGAILHEVAHNLQSDLGLSLAIPRAIGRRLLAAGVAMPIVKTWVRWNRETFADMSGLLLGGPAIIASLMDVVGRAPEMVYGFDPNGVHPTPFLRVLLSTELLRRMGFTEESARYRGAWLRLYPDSKSGNFPPEMLRRADEMIALVVDAICYRPFAELGGRRLSEVFRFAPKEQVLVEEAARRLAQGTDPGVVPERFLIGATRFALDHRLAAADTIQHNFYQELARR
jgi:hypothetical protein